MRRPKVVPRFKRRQLPCCDQLATMNPGPSRTILLSRHDGLGLLSASRAIAALGWTVTIATGRALGFGKGIKRGLVYAVCFSAGQK